MPDNQGKTSNFLQAINKYAEEQRTKIQTEAETFKKQELEKAEAEILNDAYQLIQKEMAEMRSAISSELSKKEMAGRKELFEKRKLITEEVFTKATKELTAFTKSKEYPSLLKKYTKAIAAVLTEPGTILYVKEEDFSFADELKTAFGKKNCSVQISNDITIGGIYGYNASMGIIADETLDTKLDVQHEWFAENSGLKLV